MVADQFKKCEKCKNVKKCDRIFVSSLIIILNKSSVLNQSILSAISFSSLLVLSRWVNDRGSQLGENYF
ncbi:hypothetical protein BpHYR1_016213 [Brachionus plicatilis]|uniref:Uncharacterized protein n=1 Tax=Brachionus plicatilis TaxID=10195 RepID=A0A3M7RH69_BRAPC|nr:hypothetical protein BpHYR1_016213 [Brachionus plicatilis]